MVPHRSYQACQTCCRGNSSQRGLLLSAPIVTGRSHLEVLFKLKVTLESNSGLGYSCIKLDVLHQLSSECGPLPNTGFGLFFSVELLNYKPKAVVVNEPHTLRRKSVVD